jgi:hypothetical protein
LGFDIKLNIIEIYLMHIERQSSSEREFSAYRNEQKGILQGHCAKIVIEITQKDWIDRIDTSPNPLFVPFF